MWMPDRPNHFPDAIIALGLGGWDDGPEKLTRWDGKMSIGEGGEGG